MLLRSMLRTMCATEVIYIVWDLILYWKIVLANNNNFARVLYHPLYSRSRCQIWLLLSPCENSRKSQRSSQVSITRDAWLGTVHKPFESLGSSLSPGFESPVTKISNDVTLKRHVTLRKLCTISFEPFCWSSELPVLIMDTPKLPQMSVYVPGTLFSCGVSRSSRSAIWTLQTNKPFLSNVI